MYDEAVYDQTEVVNYGSTAHHDQEEPLMQTPAPAPAGYTSLNDLKSPDSKRPLLKFLAAGFLVSAVVLAVFFVASGTLGRWFGAAACAGGPSVCDLETVVNSFCPDKIPCTISDDCGAMKECYDSVTKKIGVECKPGECFCEENTCGMSVDGKVMSLGGIKIGPEGGKKLAWPLSWDTKVEKVQLWETEIGDEGSVAIANAVANHPSVKFLNLAGNGMTDEACKEMGEAIAKNTRIVDLNLSDNSITNDGAQPLADGLKQNNSMRIFNLWKNKIGEQGALYLADAFKYNLDLRKLFLTDNAIDSGGLGSEALTTASDSRDNLEITFEGND